MNQGEEPYEIPVPWFLIKHPQGDVIIDGGMPIEAALDKHKHWGSVADVYDPVMKVSEWCRDQVKTVNTNPEDVKNVIQTHLHLDHSGAIGHFPNATHITQRIEYDYAFNPDWFSQPAYVREDFDKPNIRWKFLQGKKTDYFDLYGDGVIKIIFTPGHTPGHQSVLLNLPKTGHMLLTGDACYTGDHWCDRCLPGLVSSASDAADSVAKLRKIAKETNAKVVWGHDPVTWLDWNKAPMFYYD
jgi:glyoxylase-like metal-dependent hydrolase (beta-lactamase superfamily II)